MGALCDCMFQTGYKIYADTCVGKRIHANMLSKLRSQHGMEAMHSHRTPFRYGELIIQPIPIMYTNYTYIIGDLEHRTLVLIDVGDPALFIKFGVRPDAILTTHKHWDHSYGNQVMCDAFGDIPVYGSLVDHVPGASVNIQDGDVLKFGRLEFTAINTPGHTKGHMCYCLNGDAFGVPLNLFTGDHLMTGGCGANFEGSVLQMIDSLEMLKTFPSNTLVWPGHENGLNNLFMATCLEPDNNIVYNKLVKVYYQRMMKLCTCPSTLGEEQEYNPFLRTRDKGLLTKLGLDHLLTTMSVEQVGVACFNEIISRGRDKSKETMARREAIMKRVAEHTSVMFDMEPSESCSLLGDKAPCLDNKHPSDHNHHSSPSDHDHRPNDHKKHPSPSAHDNHPSPSNNVKHPSDRAHSDHQLNSNIIDSDPQSSYNAVSLP